MDAWVIKPFDDRLTDRRLPHKHSPNRPITQAHLRELGVLHWQIDVDNWESDPTLEKIRQEHGYIYGETLIVSPNIMDNFEEKTEHFFQEHLHPYEESRLILDGSGFWDIRDYNGDWIRFNVKKGDMITLQQGMYHRFTLDTKNYIKALLLYKEVPTRVDILKPYGDEINTRKEYVQNVLNNPHSMFKAPFEGDHMWQSN